VTTPNFVVIGHAARDVTPDGWELGGTVTFAAVQAHRLGRSVGVVTRASADVDVAAKLPFAEVIQGTSADSTSFRNVYEGGKRTQTLVSVADPIDRADMPENWRTAPIVLLGPLWGELAAGFAGHFADASLVGVSAQGWLRTADADGRVVHRRWEGPPFWKGADAVFVSDEDLVGDGDELERWATDAGTVVMTESWRGARVYDGGRWRRMDAFPEAEVDPTGAGDTFAAAFLIRLSETGNIDEAARFGAAAASLSVGGRGPEAIPDRPTIERRLAEHPGVALR
jgi:sugar/nucleoside kinase (ribokinase family)